MLKSYKWMDGYTWKPLPRAPLCGDKNTNLKRCPSTWEKIQMSSWSWNLPGCWSVWRAASLAAKLLTSSTTSQGTTRAPLCNNTNPGSIPTLHTHTNQLSLGRQKQISTFFTRASSARSQTACLHRQTVDGARLGSWGMRSTEDSTCSVQGLSGGRKSGWPWCLIQLITRWSQSRRLEREAGLGGVSPIIHRFNKISWSKVKFLVDGPLNDNLGLFYSFFSRRLPAVAIIRGKEYRLQLVVLIIASEKEVAPQPMPHRNYFETQERLKINVKGG